MTKSHIIGAGLAGLLAANMLRHREPLVVEQQPELPNNHSAVLRFRSSVVGDTLGLPFREVTMIKDVVRWRNPVADALAYAKKNGNVIRSDRSIIAGHTVATRYIAPPDLIERMAARVNIAFGEGYAFPKEHSKGAIISTIPMPVLMKALKYPRIEEAEFRNLIGTNIKAKVKNCDAYVTLSVPDPSVTFSRVSITGDELIIEAPNVGNILYGEDAYVDETIEQAADMLGIYIGDIGEPTLHRQQYAKIAPIDEALRRDFVYWASHERGVYSLGRFATWRPGLLLDDLVKDIRLIDGWVDGNNNYGRARAR
jgi:hypothetical protein